MPRERGSPPTAAPAELLLFDDLEVEASVAPSGHAPPSAVDRAIVDDLVARAATLGVVLELVDEPHGPGRRCRFYRLHLQPNLFGGAVDLVRTWGRAGTVHHHPRHLSTVHPDESTARAALRPLLWRRLRRGYRPRGSPGPHAVVTAGSTVRS
jgi:predicted DNA-binding WGR domain protein